MKFFASTLFLILGLGSTVAAVASGDVPVTGMTNVAAGDSHSCAITSGGAVQCWGGNSFGQLGNNSTINSLTPVVVSGLGSGVTAIAAGSSHTCAITSGGAVMCWGDNTDGRLGNNSTTRSLIPVPVTGMASGATGIAAGGIHTCALISGGAVQCWGGNSGGELGNNSTTRSLTPVPVTGLSSSVIAITAGVEHTCALTSGGGVQCWGWNAIGQLGNNSTTASSIPVAVNGLGSGVTAIAAGRNNTCAITSGGAVQCWGYNRQGQLGNNSTTDSLIPVPVNGLGAGVTAITVGGIHTCALNSGGAVQCWGANDLGELGNNSTTGSLIPVPATGMASGVTAIAAGSWHTCALNSGGAVQCWGANSYGQLGNGLLGLSLTPASVVLPGTTTILAADSNPSSYGRSVTLTASVSGTSTTPVGTLTFVDGASILCASVALAGTVATCTTSAFDAGSHLLSARYSGDINNAPSTGTLTQVVNQAPQSIGTISFTPNNLAVGGTTTVSATASSGLAVTFDSSATPTICSVSGFTVTGVAAGTCTITANQAGNANYGAAAQVSQSFSIGAASGIYAVTSSASPVAGGSVSCTPASGIASGGSSTCSGTANSGYTFTNWGGDCASAGSSATCSLSNITAAKSVTAIFASFVVAPMVAAGSTHSIALKSDGTVLAWGNNGNGQLGDGTNASRTSPVVVTGLSGVVAVAVGYYHNLALKSDGTVAAWGYNFDGELGDSTTTSRTSPVVVTGLSGVVAVAVGAYHNLALKSDGTVVVWGRNDGGQLGDSTTTNRYSPVVTGLSGVVSVAAGALHSLALKSDGTVLAWGDNGSGQLGDSTTTSRTSPVVAGLSGVVVLAAGGSHSFALKSDGTVLAWGNNGNGQLGDGTNASRTSPVVVTGLSGVVSLAAGAHHSLALKTGGTLVSWGSNYSGELGDSTTTSRTSPVMVTGLNGVVAVDAGQDHSIALKSDGTVLAWGYNGSGQLGDSTTTNRYSPVAVTGGLNLGANTLTTTLSPTSLTFSAQSIGTGSAAQTLTLTNSGANPASIANIAVSSSFTKTTTCAASLASGASCTISVTFIPVAVGDATGGVGIARSAGMLAAAGLSGTGSLATQSIGTISFTPNTLAVGGNTTASATASSGLGVTFSTTATPTICSVSGITVTALAAGTCTVAADQLGNSTYSAAPQVTASITIGQTTQTITSFAPTSSVVFGAAPVTLTATGGASGSPVVFATSSASSICTISGTSVTFVGVGVCNLTANQAAGGNYSAAPQVTASITIGQATQTITFGTAPTVAVGGTGTVTTTGGGTGIARVYASTTLAVCTVNSSTGVVTGVIAGTCTITANQAGNANYSAAAQVVQSFSISPASQVIAGFAPTSSVVFGAAPATLTATGGASGSPLVFATSSASTICTVSGTTVTFVGVGVCNLTANQAAGGNYSAAPQVTASITIGQATQTITFGTAPTVAVGGTGTVTTTGGGSGIARVYASTTLAVCTVNSSTGVVTGVTAGTCTITANQAGNTNYSAAAQVSQNISVSALAPTSLTLSGPSTLNEGNQAQYSANLGYPDSSSKTVTPTWSASAGSINADGLYTAPAVNGSTTITLSANYSAAGVNLNANKSVTISGVAPVITLAPRVVSRTDKSAVIEWQTDEASTSQVAYGTSDLGTSASAAGYLTGHSVSLTGLQASTSYRYRVSSLDAVGNGVQSAQFEFATSAALNTTPPQILAGPAMISIGANQAVVEWRTNESTTGALVYGTTSALGLSLADATVSPTHRLSLTGLTPSTHYYLRASATDPVLNSATLSPMIDFYTSAAPDTTPPQFTQGPMVLDVTDVSLMLRLTSDEASTLTVRLTTGTSSRTITDTTLSRDHSLRVAALSPATSYRLVVGVTDQLGNGPNLAAPIDVTTKARADTEAPEFLETPNACTVNHQMARICWKTDETSDALVEYGTSSSNLDKSVTASQLITHHSIALTGLSADTQYYYRVRSTDGSGNAGQSSIADFHTAGVPDTTAPVFTTAPHISYASADRAVLEWETDEHTQGAIEYGPSSARTLRAYDTEAKKKHQISLTHLSAGTDYFVRVIATDADGNTTFVDLP
jgi:alpha-tubulin suppressor-like RCC1 family protein/phosphodiesterase/alkaline phosphatase D-like protein